MSCVWARVVWLAAYSVWISGWFKTFNAKKSFRNIKLLLYDFRYVFVVWVPPPPLGWTYTFGMVLKIIPSYGHICTSMSLTRLMPLLKFDKCHVVSCLPTRMQKIPTLLPPSVPSNHQWVRWLYRIISLYHFETPNCIHLYDFKNNASVLFISTTTTKIQKKMS